MNDNQVKDFMDLDVLKLNPNMTSIYLERNPVQAFPSYRLRLKQVLPKLEQIDGLRDRLHPARAVRRAVAAKHRCDGRALDGARPVVLEAFGPRSGADQLTIGGAVAAIGASRCRCAVELGVAEPDAPLLSFEVRRGAELRLPLVRPGP